MSCWSGLLGDIDRDLAWLGEIWVTLGICSLSGGLTIPCCLSLCSSSAYCFFSSESGEFYGGGIVSGAFLRLFVMLSGSFGFCICLTSSYSGLIELMPSSNPSSISSCRLRSPGRSFLSLELRSLFRLDSVSLSCMVFRKSLKCRLNFLKSCSYSLLKNTVFAYPWSDNLLQSLLSSL